MIYDVYVVMLDASDEKALEELALITENLTQIGENVDYKEGVRIMQDAEEAV